MTIRRVILRSGVNWPYHFYRAKHEQREITLVAQHERQEVALMTFQCDM